MLNLFVITVRPCHKSAVPNRLSHEHETRNKPDGNGGPVVFGCRSFVKKKKQFRFVIFPRPRMAPTVDYDAKKVFVGLKFKGNEFTRIWKRIFILHSDRNERRIFLGFITMCFIFIKK